MVYYEDFDEKRLEEAIEYVEKYAAFSCIDDGYGRLGFSQSALIMSVQGDIVPTGQRRTVDVQFTKDIHRARYELTVRSNPNLTEEQHKMMRSLFEE